jgi:hypothetical protein
MCSKVPRFLLSLLAYFCRLVSTNSTDCITSSPLWSPTVLSRSHMNIALSDLLSFPLAGLLPPLQRPHFPPDPPCHCRTRTPLLVRQGVRTPRDAPPLQCHCLRDPPISACLGARACVCGRGSGSEGGNLGETHHVVSFWTRCQCE